MEGSLDDSNHISLDEDKKWTNIDDKIDHTGIHVNHAMNHDKEEELRQISDLAQRETRNLLVWKFVLLILMLVTAGLVSTGTYVFLHDAQQQDFKDSVSQSQPSDIRPIQARYL
jgi:hypothetical protein